MLKARKTAISQAAHSLVSKLSMPLCLICFSTILSCSQKNTPAHIEIAPGSSGSGSGQGRTHQPTHSQSDQTEIFDQAGHHTGNANNAGDSENSENRDKMPDNFTQTNPSNRDHTSTNFTTTANPHNADHQTDGDDAAHTNSTNSSQAQSLEATIKRFRNAVYIQNVDTLTDRLAIMAALHLFDVGDTMAQNTSSDSTDSVSTSQNLSTESKAYIAKLFKKYNIQQPPQEGTITKDSLKQLLIKTDYIREDYILAALSLGGSLPAYPVETIFQLINRLTQDSGTVTSSQSTTPTSYSGTLRPSPQLAQAAAKFLSARSILSESLTQVSTEALKQKPNKGVILRNMADASDVALLHFLATLMATPNEVEATKKVLAEKIQQIHPLLKEQSINLDFAVSLDQQSPDNTFSIKVEAWETAQRNFAGNNKIPDQLRQTLNTMPNIKDITSITNTIEQNTEQNSEQQTEPETESAE